MSVQSETPLLLPPTQGRWGGPLVLAALIHGALIVALAWGVGWQKTTHVIMEAELWSRLPQTAAPAAPAAPVVAPQPPAPPQPPPPPPEPVRSETPPPPPAPLAKAEPDIATQRAQAREREKQRLAEEAKKQPEKQAAERRTAQERQRQEAQRAQQQAREKAERERREREQQAQLEAQRQRNLERMMGQASASTTSRSSGSAQQSTGPTANYAGRLVSAIKPNIVFTDLLPGNPRAEVEVRATPDGTVLSARLRQSSGYPTWDDAVLRAIERTGRLPVDENGRVPSSMILGFRPLD
jgi:colicin import membrane protein